MANTRSPQHLRGRLPTTLVAWATLVLGGCYGGAAPPDAGQGGSTGADEGDDEGWAEDGGSGDDGIDASLDPGRVTLRRLNAVEFANTARDLFFGLDIDPARDFPPDPRAVGFDNIADVLTMSPVQFELYERAADDLLDAALRDAAHSDVRDQLLFCDTTQDSCVADVVRAFGERAWRRPLTTDELDALVSEVDAAQVEGATREEGLEAALKRALLSIHFLFRVETDPEPESDAPHLVSDFELASRLSYFLWSSMPDAELFDLARDGSLQQADEIEAQVHRMLADPRAAALVDNFAGQWLYLRGIRSLTKDPTAFPDFGVGLALAMATESELFFGTFLNEDRSFLELLTSQETFVNGRLAAHYGLASPTGDTFERVSLAGQPRKGLLTQAGILSVLAHQDVTSPTVRGAWVLGQLRCAPPPAPPADVPELGGGGGGTTTRERLEEHRKDPQCAACHAQMDPIGLSFENYDAAGQWRTTEFGLPIDASGNLDGADFDDALGLIDVLAADEASFSQCTAQQLLTYALGRPLQAGSDDAGHISHAVEDFVASDHRLPELLVAIARSGAFRGRRGEPE